MSEENNSEEYLKEEMPEITGKYAKHFKKNLREDEFEPEYTEYFPVDPNIYESAPEEQTTFDIKRNLGFLAIVGTFAALGLLILVFGKTDKESDLKPKTRTVTRTVYVKREDEDQKPEKEVKKPKVGKTKEGEEIKEETTEETKEEEK
ncbi:MAG: hypothetical protein ACXAB2_06735 [Candidatus Hodarchaeales archaeon]|jgi:hypothetical protein